MGVALDSEENADADDCRSAYNAGTVRWIGGSGGDAFDAPDEYATEAETNAYNCQIVEEHMMNGQEAYGHIFDAAASFLQAEKIPHIINGDSRFYYEDTGYGPVYREEHSCLQTFGGCGADKFWIDVSLFPDLTYQAPAARVTIQSGATDTEMGYIIVGKLYGVMLYEGCDSVSSSGHTWVASLSAGEIRSGMDDTFGFSTSISRLGHDRSQKFRSYLPSYEEKTLIVRVEDFQSPDHYQTFLDMMAELPVGTFLERVN